MSRQTIKPIADPLDYSVVIGALVLATLLTIAIPDQITAWINQAIALANKTGVSIPSLPQSGKTEVGGLEPGDYGGTELDAEQLKNAAAIIAKGKELGHDDADIKIALMAALQESSLQNLDHGDDWWFGGGEGSSDSRGLFQQRASWGSEADRRDPGKSAQLFFEALSKVSDRASMQPGDAAQAVQNSAYPKEYAKWEPVAEAILSKAKATPAATASGPSSKANTQAATFRIERAVGFLIGNGKALTATHVIYAVGTSGEGETPDGLKVKWSVIKQDGDKDATRGLDLALLKVEVEGNAPVAPLTYSIEPGQNICAFGTPSNQNGQWSEKCGSIVNLDSQFQGGRSNDVEVSKGVLYGGMSGGPCYLEDGSVWGAVSGGTDTIGGQEAWCSKIPEGWVDSDASDGSATSSAAPSSGGPEMQQPGGPRMQGGPEMQQPGGPRMQGEPPGGEPPRQ